MTTEATFIGNIVSLFSGAIYIVIFSLIKPEKNSFDLKSLRDAIKVADDVDAEEEKALVLGTEDEKFLAHQSYLSLAVNSFVILGVYIVVTCALYGWGGDFSKRSFTAFMIVMMIWLLVAALLIIFFPLWQGRKTLCMIALSIMGKSQQAELVEQSIEELSAVSMDAIDEAPKSYGNKKDEVKIDIKDI